MILKTNKRKKVNHFLRIHKEPDDTTLRGRKSDAIIIVIINS